MLKKIALFLSVLFLLSACDNGGSNPTTVTAKEKAFAKIIAYAEDGNKAAPTLQDYRDVGVTAATEDNLDQLNTVVESLEGIDVDTTEELNALVTQLGVPVAVDGSATTDEDTVKAIKLNDTGMSKCANNTSNNLACPVSTHPNQDAQTGRDATHNDDSDGHAGFSFTKISSTGVELPASATEWSCVKDNVTGLMWEVKTNDGGLHDKNKTYTWYNPDNSANGGSAGTEKGDNDTDSFVVNTNATGLCGANDWRMPAREELRSLADYSVSGPAIDTTYFPNTVSKWYWSSSPYASLSFFAWVIHFNLGYDGKNFKVRNLHVRLVRSGQ